MRTPVTGLEDMLTSAKVPFPKQVTLAVTRVRTGMDPKGTLFETLSHTEKGKYGMVLYMPNLKRHDAGELVQETEADFQSELVVAGGRGGAGGVKGFRMDTHTGLYLKRITKAPLQGAGNPAQWHVAAWMGGESGGGGTHVHVWPRTFAAHLRLSQHC